MAVLLPRLRLALGALVLGTSLTGCGAFADDPSSGAAKHGDVYDESELHDVSIDLDDDDFSSMIEAYTASGDKEWLTASVRIDGLTYRDAGLRLKGNSSLRGVDAAAEPTELPWLIRLDKFVDGQAHQGWTEFVVRSNSSTTALNEAVALDLLAEAGLASEHAIATSFSVNGADPTLRLVVQHLDEAWEEENFSSTGWLYKAEAEGDWSYRGDDPESYVDVFDQETGDENLKPLTAFLDFLNNATDDEFAEQLGDRLDVDALATYLAFQDLIGNWDDIDGPGNNSYLRWDDEKQRFTVVAWDHNLAFGGAPGNGGAPGPQGRGERPDGERGATPPEGFEPPEGMTPPEGWKPPNGWAPPGQAAPEGEAGKRPGRGPMGRSNVLVERFSKVPAFAELVEEAKARLQSELIDSGRALQALDARVAVLAETDLVDDDTLTQEADAIREFLAGTSATT